MKRSIGALFFILFFIHINAQLKLNMGSFSVKNFYQETEAIFKNDKLIIEAEIGGTKSRFILDTGAPLCITNECQQKNQFKILKLDSITDANGVNHLTKIVNVDEIKIGALVFNNIPAIVIEKESPTLECVNANGLIGSNLLRFCTIQIDWKKQKVIFAKSYKELYLNKKDAEKLLINEVQSAPYLTINVDAKITDRLLIDTGSEDFYAFSIKGLEYVQSKGYLKESVKYISTGSNSIGLFGPNLNVSDKLLKIDSLTIGKMAHLHEFYSVTTNDDQSRLGVYLLSQGIMTIDYPKGLFFFQLYEKDFEYNYYSFGFEPVKQGNKLIIGSIWKNSAADLAGLSAGDEIVDVGDLSLNKEDICDSYFQLKKFIKEKQVITLHIKQSESDQIKKVQLQRMKL